MSKKFVPSELQSRFFDFVARGRGSCVLEAVAGSGKSTTIVEALPVIPASEPTLVLAFNRKIVDEMTLKVDALRSRTGLPMRNVRVATFHSLGFGALRKHLGDRVKTNKNKSRDVARQLWNKDTCALYEDFACQLAAYAKGEGLGVLAEDSDWAYKQIVEHHDLELASEEADLGKAIALTRELLARSVEVAKDKGVVDYDDMLYLPLLWRLRFFGQSWVFVDEAQDTNPVRRAIVRRVLRPGGRVVAVGDRRQAIYGFTGASADALDQIAQDFNAARLPLNVSYRCPSLAETLVAAHAPEFRAAPGARRGEEVRGASIDEALRHLTSEDAVLCRNTAPLVSLAYALIRRKVACHVAGRDIGVGLAALVKKMNAKTVDGLLEKLEVYREREVAKLLTEKKESRAEAVNDKVDCVLEFVANLGENQRTVPKLLAAIDECFADGAGTLTLCTMHRSKGLEWKTVAILREDLCPSKWARQAHQHEQELNLQYVAHTRFMEKIVFLAEDGTEGRPRRAANTNSPAGEQGEEAA